MSTWRTGPVDDFPNRRETPWPVGLPRPGGDHNGEPPEVLDPKGLMLNRRPDTPLQALMEAAPHQEPVESKQEQAQLADDLAAAIAAMDDRYRWVFQAHVNRGRSFQQIADELAISKTHAHYLYRKGVEQLQELLADSDAVTRRLVGS